MGWWLLAAGLMAVGLAGIVLVMGSVILSRTITEDERSGGRF